MVVVSSSSPQVEILYFVVIGKDLFEIKMVSSKLHGW